jgi:hypothetical protein
MGIALLLWVENSYSPDTFSELLLLVYRTIYPLSHLSTSDTLKSNFPVLLDTFNSPRCTARLIVLLDTDV